jgi:sulfite exporter TauE/SafE
MNEPLTFGAAWLLGLVASGHCLLMCGGITAALGVATARTASGRPRPDLLIGYQLGRILSYALAGLLLAGALGRFVAWLDVDWVRRMLRALAALALVLAAIVAVGGLRDPSLGAGQWAWRRIAPFGRRWLPVDTLNRSLAFGALWGWMPCGHVYMVLMIAALQADATRGALTMLAFGLGTAPAMLAASFGAERALGAARRPRARRLAAVTLLACAALTLAGPWWMAH